MAKVAGSFWVDGSTLHYIDPAGNEWFFTGTAGSTPGGAVKGSIWVDGFTIHYIDFTGGVDRSVNMEAGANRSGVGAKAGSIWVEDTSSPVYKALHAISSLQVEYAAHLDVHHDVAAVPHGDAPASHGDVPAGHLDHTDSPSSHGDVPHHDYHYDGHLDGYNGPDSAYSGLAKASHGDSHDDAALELANYGYYHYDASPYTDHSDWPHADTTVIGHGDVAHVDNASPDTYHSLGHYDGGSWHSDNSAMNHTPGPDWFQQPLTPGATGSYSDSHYDYTVTSAGHDDATVGHTDTTTPHNDTAAVGHIDSHDDQPTAV